MHALLRALESLVSRDRGPVQLDGVIVVAVKSGPGAGYWHAAFAGERLLGCGPLAGLPRDADAILVFDDAQANDVLAGRKPKAKPAMFGRGALLEKFVERYCAFRSFVDVRSNS